MKVIYTAAFKKRPERLSEKIQNKFVVRIILFNKNPRHPLLKTHPLKGNLSSFRAFSVTGDVRVIFEVLDEKMEAIKLVDIGTHNQVY